MHIKWYSNFTFSIPWDNQNHSFTAEGFETNSSGMWYVWMMSSHTHKYGNDFDIFYRNPDGTQGAQVYEGYYNSEYYFNQGFYDWQHPPRRYFDPFLPVNPEDGFIYTTTYKNTSGPALVLWGATGSDEMMIMYVHYTENNPSTGILNNPKNSLLTDIFPNPAKTDCRISYSLSENSKITIEILNVMGEKISVLASGENQPAGNHTQDIHLPQMPGYYFIRLTANDNIEVKPLIVSR